MKSKNAQTANILHLSDLHITNIEDAGTWHGQLADDLKIELDCNRLDALVISGDIPNKSLPEEYEAAALFLKALCLDFEQRAPNPAHCLLGFQLACLQVSQPGKMR